MRNAMGHNTEQEAVTTVGQSGRGWNEGKYYLAAFRLGFRYQ